MRSLKSTLSLAALLSLPASPAFLPSAHANNAAPAAGNAPAAAAAATAPTVAAVSAQVKDAAVSLQEKPIHAALEAWKQAMLKKDGAALEKLYHPELMYGHSSGLLENKQQAIDHVVKGAGWDAITMTETTIRLRGYTALVTNKVDMHERGSAGVSISKLVVLTVWVKGPAGWQLIGRQATKVT
jgi:ketosteroid isomerase-like protein